MRYAFDIIMRYAYTHGAFTYHMVSETPMPAKRGAEEKST